MTEDTSSLANPEAVAPTPPIQNTYVSDTATSSTPPTKEEYEERVLIEETPRGNIIDKGKGKETTAKMEEGSTSQETPQ